MNHDLEELLRELSTWAEQDALGLVVALMDLRAPKPSARAVVKRMLMHSRIAPTAPSIVRARLRNKSRLKEIANKCVIREIEGKGNQF